MTVILKANVLHETGFGSMSCVEKDHDYGERAQALRYEQPTCAHALDLLEQAKSAYSLTKRGSDTVVIRILAERQYEMKAAIILLKDGAEQYYAAMWGSTLKGIILGVKQTLDLI